MRKLILFFAIIISTHLQAQQADTTKMQYVISSVAKNTDGSVNVVAYFNIFGFGYWQTVSFAPGTALSDVQVGMGNYGAMLYKHITDSISGIGLYMDLQNLKDTVTIR